MTGAATIDESYDDPDEGAGLSGFWILIIFLAVLAAFSGIVYIAYQKGLHERAGIEAELPQVYADPDPARTEITMTPADPGRPEVEQQLNDPTPSRVVASVDANADPLASFSADDTPAASVSVPTDEQLATDNPNPSAASPAAAVPATVAPSTTTDAIAGPAAPKIKPTASRPTAVTSPSSSSTASTVSATHAVQVGAFGSRDEAMEFYGRLMVKLGPLVGNQRPEVRVANVRGRDYYRLWIGAFGSQTDANAYCGQLSSRGQDCYVQKR